MIIDRLIHEDLLSDSADRVRARSLVFFTLSVASAGIATLLFVLVAEQSLPPRRLISTVLISSLIIPVCMIKLSPCLKWPSRITISLTLIAAYYVHYNNMALRGPTTVFFILPPLITALLVGGRATFIVCCLSLGAIIFNFVLMKMGLLPPPIMQLENAENIALASSIIIVTVVTAIFYGLFNLYKQREDDLSAEMRKGRELLEELVRAKEAAEQSAKSKAMFLATMSHELRTPLNSVIGNSTLLAKGDLPPSSKERIVDIQLAANLLLTLINDILDISKFDSVGVELHPRPYDLTQQLQQLHHMYSANIPPKVAFELVLPPGPLFVNADPNRIAQITLNFLSNAAKFTEQGRIVLGVSTEQNESLKLFVEDTGTGIEKADQARLFEDFVQAGNAGNRLHRGTGLGLSIVNRIVEAMEGQIDIDSEPGIGTHISATLPLKTQHGEAALAQIDTDGANGSNGQLENRTILIVDDVEMNCVVLKSLLESLGISACATVNSGQQAIDFIDQHPDTEVILMDVRMQNMDGLQATRILRQKGYTNPIIAVTANAFAEDRAACLEAGMNGFISKPVDISELARVLDRLTD